MSNSNWRVEQRIQRESARKTDVNKTAEDALAKELASLDNSNVVELPTPLNSTATAVATVRLENPLSSRVKVRELLAESTESDLDRLELIIAERRATLKRDELVRGWKIKLYNFYKENRDFYDSFESMLQLLK